jgi:hypothetical protein
VAEPSVARAKTRVGVRSAGDPISQYAGVRGVGFVSIDCAVGMSRW